MIKPIKKLALSKISKFPKNKLIAEKQEEKY
jgi:hypothetical protein